MLKFQWIETKHFLLLNGAPMPLQDFGGEDALPVFEQQAVVAGCIDAVPQAPDDGSAPSYKGLQQLGLGNIERADIAEINAIELAEIEPA